MTDEQLTKLKNIFAFLSILFGEDANCVEAIMNMSPEYMLEKYERYVEATRNEWEWGLHPSLRIMIFNPYFERWNIRE